MQKIEYKNLNPKQKELFNFAKVSALLADYGYFCIRLSDDWGNADFLAVGIDGNTLKVQLKSRLTISKKYLDKHLFMMFPCVGRWVLIEHDKLISIIADVCPSMLESQSWTGVGQYSCPTDRQILLPYLEEFFI